MGITARTFERWVRDGEIQSDRRPVVVRPRPSNRLTDTERADVLRVVNEPRFASLPPTQIVPILADEGQYLASESTFYRLLREENQLQHRGHARAPQARPVPRHHATGPNQLYAWDITYLPGPIAGMFFFLYLVLDVYSRKIVAHEVHDAESAERAAQLIEQAVHREAGGCQGSCRLNLHAASRNMFSSAGRFNQTSSGSDQLRMLRLQRSGCFARARS